MTSPLDDVLGLPALQKLRLDSAPFCTCCIEHRCTFASIQMRFIGFCLAITTCAWSQVLDGSTRADWPHYGGGQAAWRYSALDQINTSNVKNLTPAWIFQTGDTSDGLHSTPI